MNSLWDIRIFLGLVPKESPCMYRVCGQEYSVLQFGVSFERCTTRSNKLYWMQNFIPVS
jgi:hypothetical protein